MGSKFRRAYGSFTADIEDIVAVSEQRMIAVMRQSLQDVVDNAQLPTAKGGRMRVDTGFLRASGQASLTGMPQGPIRGTKDDTYSTDDSEVIATLGEMKLGAIFFFGWTANYAQYREIYDGFLEGALQHWGSIVAINTDTLRQRIKK